MITHTLNPTIFQIGFFQLRWYSIFYIVGLIIGYFFISQIVKERKIKLSRDEVIDYLVYLAMGLLVGGRIIYFLFYDISGLVNDPVEVFKLWHGGISFHGGLIGAFVAGYIYVKKNKLDFWEMADITVIPLGLALALGRLGNFINGELFGRVWDGFLCIDYSQNPHLGNFPSECRYPSQFVESLKNLVIFSILYSVRKMKLPKGCLFWLFVTMYGVLRFFIEFIRAPDPQLGLFFGVFTMGQFLCSAMIMAGSYMLYRKLHHK